MHKAHHRSKGFVLDCWSQFSCLATLCKALWLLNVAAIIYVSVGLVFSASLFGQSPPNVVLIVSDDQAYGDYSFMGHPHIKTPNIDRLAAESLTFRRGYVPSSLCCPSLATILTGRYPHQHKITTNDPPLVPGLQGKAYQESEMFLAGRQRMNDHMAQVPTLPRILKEHGYLTMQTGKFWQGHFSNGGFTHGMTRGDRHGDDGLSIGRQTLKPIEDFIDMATTEKQPWMVWYAPLLPHDPHNPPA